VTLTVSVEEAVRRAEADATRTVSRDRGFLHRHYAAAQAALEETPSTDFLLDTECMTAGEAARVIARSADAQASSAMRSAGGGGRDARW
jgi:chloramphenicol 3-O-phosphotransferase